LVIYTVFQERKKNKSLRSRHIVGAVRKNNASNHITFIMTTQITRNMFCGTRVCPTESVPLPFYAGSYYHSVVMIDE